MKKILVIPFFISVLLVTCTKEIQPVRSSKPEICDFGPLNKNTFQTREEFEMERVGGSPKLKDFL